MVVTAGKSTAGQIQLTRHSVWNRTEARVENMCDGAAN